MRRIKTMEARFWAKVDKSGPTMEGAAYDGLGPCWLYRGGSTIGMERSHLITEGPTRAIVSRYAWELHNGPIPDGKIVRHRCDNGHIRCVNPAHLELGTQADNIRDHYKRRKPRRGILAPATIELCRIALLQYRVPIDILAGIAEVHPSTMELAVRSGGVALAPLRRAAPKVTDEEAERAMALIRAGASVSDAAKKLGRSWVTIHRALTSRGHDLPVKDYRRVTEDQIVEVLRLHRAGHAIYDIARTLGIHWPNVKRVLRLRGELGLS